MVEKDWDNVDYAGEHESPDKESGAPLYDVTLNGIYPDDVYSYNGLRYYGTGEERMDSVAWSLIRSSKNRPNYRLRVYRAVPKDVECRINIGDWVTPIRKYAKLHGESNLGGQFKICSKDVAARDIFTAGDSWLEWGYDPQPYVPKNRAGGGD